MTPEMLLEIWNVIATKEQLAAINKEHPDILSNFSLQKRLFGINMFEAHKGHKAPKQLSNINKDKE